MKKNKLLTTMISEEAFETLKVLAEKEGSTVSTYIRRKAFPDNPKFW